MAMFTRRLEFARDHGLQRVLNNFRDFCVACAENMPWVIRLTRHVAKLALQFSGTVFGIIWEEPTGCLFPFEIVDWVSEVRAVMDDAGWQEGHLLLHIHRGTAWQRRASSSAWLLAARGSGARRVPTVRPRATRAAPSH